MLSRQHRLFVCTSVVLVVAACDAAVGGTDATRRRPVPIVDYSPRTAVGIYHWGADYRAYPGTPDRLSWGAGLIRGMGARTTRVVVSPMDPYGPVAPTSTTLRQTAESAPYRVLFEDPDIVSLRRPGVVFL